MNIKNKITKEEFFIFLILFSAFLFQCIRFNAFLGDDFYWHIQFAEQYASGKFAMFNETLIKINGTPYPPLFHLFLTLGKFSWGDVISFGKFLHLIFYPLTLFSSTFLAYKICGKKVAVLVSLILITSLGFYDRAHQPIPQAIDMIMFPLSVYFFIRNSNWFYLTTIIPIYSHGAVGLILYFPFFLYDLIFYKKIIVFPLLLALPMIIIIFLYFPTMVATHSALNINPQKLFYTQNPHYLLFYIGFSSFVIPFLFSKEFYKKLIENKLGKILLLSILSLLIMAIFWIDRFAEYVTIPLAFIVSIWFDWVLCKKQKHKKILWIIFLMFLFAIYLLSASILISGVNS